MIATYEQTLFAPVDQDVDPNTVDYDAAEASGLAGVVWQQS